MKVWLKIALMLAAYMLLVVWYLWPLLGMQPAYGYAAGTVGVGVLLALCVAHRAWVPTLLTLTFGTVCLFFESGQHPYLLRWVYVFAGLIALSLTVVFIQHGVNKATRSNGPKPGVRFGF